MRTSTFAGSICRRKWLGVCLLGLGCITFGSCRGTYPTARRGEADLSPYARRTKTQFQETNYAPVQAALPQIAGAEYVNDDELCATCHEAYAKTFKNNVHREQSCEKCHGPASEHLKSRGKDPNSILSFKRMDPAQASEVCLQCHENDPCEPGARWRTSVHAHSGVTCVNCHTSHYNAPPDAQSTSTAQTPYDADGLEAIRLVQNEEPYVDQASLRVESQHLGAVTPTICYRCHSGMRQLEQVAHPHQVCGAAGFDCTTCHDPHGAVREETRTDLCLQCHDQSTPTMAWHSSTHSMNGVGCTDCHNPHPNANPLDVVNIQHTTVEHPPRLPMSVNEPFVCYGCHPKIYSMTSLPSHHPIKEGKMVCSDCHDAHGQTEDNLKEMSINLVCYRCHAEKQGPFAFAHPPVTENCAICHDPHGTVALNLLRQPPTFLCLRCHAGHRKDNRTPDLTWVNDIAGAPHASGAVVQAAQYTNCTQCHAQIHGTDIPSNTGRGTFLR